MTADRDPATVIGEDAGAADELVPLVYSQLRQLAAQMLRGERPGQTLQATASVHEVCLRVTRRSRTSWLGRRHFFNAAAVDPVR